MSQRYRCRFRAPAGPAEVAVVEPRTLHRPYQRWHGAAEGGCAAARTRCGRLPKHRCFRTPAFRRCGHFSSSLGWRRYAEKGEVKSQSSRFSSLRHPMLRTHRASKRNVRCQHLLCRMALKFWHRDRSNHTICMGIGMGIGIGIGMGLVEIE